MQDIKFDLAVWLIWICHKISLFLSLAVSIYLSLFLFYTRLAVNMDYSHDTQ